jgi:hypothetical protein
MGRVGGGNSSNGNMDWPANCAVCTHHCRCATHHRHRLKLWLYYLRLMWIHLAFQFFIFWGLHPVASIITIFLGSINHNCIFADVFYYYYILITCFGPYGPSSGGIYWLIPKEQFFYNRSIVLVLGVSCIYIYIYISFLFWRFFCRCLYVWWIWTRTRKGKAQK